MFINYVSIILWVIPVVLRLLFDYANRNTEPLVKRRFLAIPLACAALLLGLPGLLITLTWPLPGSANIIIGEPTFYFSVLLGGAAVLIFFGADLRVLTPLVTIGGIMLICMAFAIAANGIGAPPPSEGAIGHPPISTAFSSLWALAYICTGICAIASLWVLRNPHPAIWDGFIRLLLWVAIGIFAIQAVVATLTHVAQYTNWVPTLH
jgi:uncharacterized membrane protein